MTVFGRLILINIAFLRFYFSVFLLASVLIAKIYQILETVFHRLSLEMGSNMVFLVFQSVFGFTS